MGTLDIRLTNEVWWKWEVFAIPVSVGEVTWEDPGRQRVNGFFFYFLFFPKRTELASQKMEGVVLGSAVLDCIRAY